MRWANGVGATKVPLPCRRMGGRSTTVHVEFSCSCFVNVDGTGSRWGLKKEIENWLGLIYFGKHKLPGFPLVKFQTIYRYYVDDEDIEAD